jgi:nitrite reductase/ring-hydroxylating ferredoxin subunit
MAGQWHRVAAAAEVPQDGAVQVQVGEDRVAVFNLAGRFFATSDICTHAFAFLTDGCVDGEHVECPLHQALFHIPTGAACGAPATEDLRTYAVKVEDGEVFIHA